MNKFGFVSNLYDSTMTNSPSIDCFVWFMGDSADPIDSFRISRLKEIKQAIKTKKNFQLITMKQMEESLENFSSHKFAFLYNLIELQNSLKPFAFQYALKELRANAVIFLSNEIWVTDSLEEIQYQLFHRSCVVTPHYSSPVPEDGKNQRDKYALAEGVYNFGFVSFSNTPASASFLNWWAEKMSLYGFDVVEKHMFYDQNWGMFIPAFFEHEDYFVIRDHRYNVAYWNLHERGKGLHMKDGAPHLTNSKTGEEKKVIFMNFSGMSVLEMNDTERISIHQNRFSLLDFPRLRDVLKAYKDLVAKHNITYYQDIPYGYEHFTDGTLVEPYMRKVYAAAIYPNTKNEFHQDIDPPYRTNSPFLRVMFKEEVLENPFCATPSCHDDSTKINFYQWMWKVLTDKSVDANGVFYYSFLERSTWNHREDLRVAFPDPFGENLKEWRDWFQENAVQQHAISKNTHKKWKSTLDFNIANHWKFHDKIENIKDDVGVNMLGWHAGHFSVGISGAKILRSALKVGMDINAIEMLIPPRQRFKTTDQLDFPLSRSISHPITFAVVNADSMPRLYRRDVPPVIWAHKYNIGYWAWELDRFRPEWMISLSKLDEVWCPSTFIQNAIKNTEGYELHPIPIRVLPIPHEKKKIVKKESEKQSVLLHNIFEDHKKTKPFVFLIAFDFQSFVDRKNPHASIKAFLDAFPAEQDKQKKYQLIVKSHHGTSSDLDEMRKLANYDPRVIFLNELLSDSDNQKLYEHQDCFLSLHRSEGYGMIILETLSNGIPIIATNYSGNVDFFTAIPQFRDKCAFPVSYRLIELEESFGPYRKGNRWADPDHDSAVEAMRKVVKNDCKQIHGKNLSKAMLDIFGSEAVGQRMKNMIKESLPAAMRKQEKTFEFVNEIQRQYRVSSTD